MIGADVYLKCESFQRAGAFKFRGAYNALSMLDPALRSTGVLTHSSGNHAQALALASSLLGTNATIVMPREASKMKRAAALAYGARIVPCDAIERESVAASIEVSEGLSLIHPYDNRYIIAGQGTSALELLQDIGELDLILVPVGGGGLCSGTCLAAAAIGSKCKVIGVEPEVADDAVRSWREGVVHTLEEVPSTVADGLRTRRIGDLNLAVMRAHLDDMVTVTDSQILEAMRFLWLRMKLVVEPSGAAALSALLAGKILADGKRVGVIVSGGNIDPFNIASLLLD